MEKIGADLFRSLSMLVQFWTPSMIIQVIGLILLICVYHRKPTILIRPLIRPQIYRKRKVQFHRQTLPNEGSPSEDNVTAKWKNVASVLQPLMGSILKSQPVRDAIGSAREDSLWGLLKVILDEKLRR